MSTEKTRALVIRQADFSESSRVLTLFSRDFGKISCLAKGAKRLKGAFELSLDLLAECDIVFIKKSGGGLDLLTEARLVRRFQPLPGNLFHLYAGYYVAELLGALTEEDDPHPELYQSAVAVLEKLAVEGDLFSLVSLFEISVLREIGQLPDFDTCTICHSPLPNDASARFWVAQSGLICSRCGHPDYDTTAFHAGTLAILRQLQDPDSRLAERIVASPIQIRELRRLLSSAVTHVLGRRPKTLSLLNFSVR